MGAVVGSQSLRRGQNGGQGAFGAVKMGSKWLKMAHNGSKWLKIGPKWPTVGSKWLKMPTVGSKWDSIGLKWCHNGSALAHQPLKLRLEIEIDPGQGGPLRVREGGSLTRKVRLEFLKNRMVFDRVDQSQ